MTYPILITVRYSNQAYHCRLHGVGASSVRITEAEDGHYYLDVRRKTGLAFRADSRHSSLDAALDRARVAMSKEAVL